MWRNVLAARSPDTAGVTPRIKRSARARPNVDRPCQVHAEGLSAVDRTYIWRKMSAVGTGQPHGGKFPPCRPTEMKRGEGRGSMGMEAAKCKRRGREGRVPYSFASQWRFW